VKVESQLHQLHQPWGTETHASHRDYSWLDALIIPVGRAVLERSLLASGVTIDGDKPSDPQIVHPRFYRRVLVEGTLGAGEAYIDGDWECPALDEFSARLVKNDVRAHLQRSPEIVAWLKELMLNRQAPGRSARDVTTHYDLGNDLYEAMLGPSMAYSCGYWRAARTLIEAQTAKFELICKKLWLRPGQRLLDIGCGWGTLAHYAAEQHGVNVVGITVSPAQVEYARNTCKGLPVEIRLQDYRTLTERFDAVVSVGMFEHVGARNYDHYMDTAARCLRPGGLFLLHTIGGLRPSQTNNPWLDKHIFPGSNIPSLSQIVTAAEPYFVVEDCENFGADYDRTLLAWWQNFDRAWPSLRHRYGDRFYRIWRYYLLTCAGSFRARNNQLWQLVLSKDGLSGGYERVNTPARPNW